MDNVKCQFHAERISKRQAAAANYHHIHVLASIAELLICTSSGNTSAQWDSFFSIPREFNEFSFEKN